MESAQVTTGSTPGCATSAMTWSEHGWCDALVPPQSCPDRVLAPQSQSHPSFSLILLEHQAHLESQYQHFLQSFPIEPGSITLSTYYCQTLVLFEFLKTVLFIPFPWLNNIPLYGCTSFCFLIHQLTDIFVSNY